MSSILKYSLFFIIFSKNIFSLQVPSRLIHQNTKKSKSTLQNKNILHLLHARKIGKTYYAKSSLNNELKNFYLPFLEKEFKKALLARDNKQFYNTVMGALTNFSAPEIAEILYKIFRNSENDNFYLNQFFFFLKYNKEWLNFKRNFLTEISNIQIIFYLLEHTLLSYPISFYHYEQVKIFDKAFDCFHHDEYSNFAYTNYSAIFYKNHIFFALYALPSLTKKNQKKLESSIKQAFLEGLFFKIPRSLLRNNLKLYPFLSIIRVSFLLFSDQFKQFEDWIDKSVTNSFLMQDILKTLIEESPLVATLSHLSKFFQFQIESLYITKDYNEEYQNSICSVVFKIKQNICGDPSLEFYEEKNKIEKAIESFLKKGNSKKLFKILKTPLSVKFQNIKEKDFAQIFVNFSKYYTGKRNFTWKKLMQKKPLFKEKIKAIYKKLPCHSEKELELKRNFAQISFLLENPPSKDLNHSA